MQTFTRAPAADAAALASTIVLGSGAGVALGLAFLLASAPHPAPPPPPRTAPALQAALSPPLQALPPLRPRLELAGPVALAAGVQPVALAAGRLASELQCLTEVVYFEARGEAPEGQRAVAQVVMNRLHGRSYPKTVCGVAHQRTAAGCQFSFACHDTAPVREGPAWRRAEGVASAALHGAVMAAVGDATRFQAARAGPLAGFLRVAQVGAHAFYRLGGRQEAPAAALAVSTESRPSPALQLAAAAPPLPAPPPEARRVVAAAAPDPALAAAGPSGS